ncbi:hypothetical protein F4779DRAFT_634679 [Xylariaceae sp. FL0662B]|nr:hypothetical protein F4779DRAFT_634679 [Xylariaceae sp. FL0662B]
MAHREASQPLQRHRTHRRRAQKNSSRSSNDGPHSKHRRLAQNSTSNLGKLYRMSQSPSGNDMVENWLEQMANQTHYPWSGSPRHREDIDHPDHPPGVTFSSNRTSTRLDPGWNLRYAPAIANAPSPGPLGKGSRRNSNRQHCNLSDSSFISGFEARPRTPDDEDNHKPFLQECKDSGLDYVNDPSFVSRKVGSETFEKRPRHKIRASKYDTKKKREPEKEKTKGHENRRSKRHRKSEKRKSMASGKNVVNNFASDAVLNDRITIQPSLKPGLFNNGRVSKNQPISDLVFSKMQFPSHQKRNAQPKPLSESRLRDRRRENREIEEASSFFLPPKANGNPEKSRLPNIDGYKKSESLRRHHDRENILVHGRGVSRSSPSNDRKNPKHHRDSPVFHDEAIETPSLDLQNSTKYRQVSSKNTTYFTWSRSSRSPCGRQRNETSSHKASSWTTTPEPIREALVATGIYRGTGIRLYDDSTNKQATDAATIPVETPEPRDTVVQNIFSNRHDGHTKTSKMKHRDQAMMPDKSSRSLEQRLSDILPSAWRFQHKVVSPRRLPITEERQILQLQGQEAPGSSRYTQSTQSINREQISREIHIRSPRGFSSRQHAQTPNVIGASLDAEDPNPGAVDKIVNGDRESQIPASNDRASITSKDAMPPPPLPPGRHTPKMIACSNQGEDHHFQESHEELLKAPGVPNHTAHNDTPQHVHELLNSYNRFTLSPELITGIERTLSSLDTASWLPQPRTPSIEDIQRQHTMSRLHMDSTIYMDQLEQELRVEDSKSAPSSRTQPYESMTEFIAKIESESQLLSPVYEIDHAESDYGQYGIIQDLLGSSTAPLCEPQSIHTVETEDILEPAYSLQRRPRHLRDTIDQQQLRAPDHEEFMIGTAYGAEIPKPFSNISQPLEDLEDERFEMSRFWRPNQFSQF